MQRYYRSHSQKQASYVSIFYPSVFSGFTPSEWDFRSAWLNESPIFRAGGLDLEVGLSEVQSVLALVDTDEDRLIFQLLYGTGMRMMGGLRMRVKDPETEAQEVLQRADIGEPRLERLCYLCGV